MTTHDLIKVVIIDDHDGVRAGIRGLLRKAADIEVIAEGVNGQEAVRLACENDADVMLLDVELPIMRGDEVVRRIRNQKCPVKVLAVSSYDDRQYISGMLDNGAQGYITKEEASELLVDAIRLIAGGQSPWISPRASRFTRSQPSARPFNHKTSMTPREAEIMRLLAEGAAVSDIAQAAGMASDRLDIYLQVLMVKYGVDSHERLRKIAKTMLDDDLRQ